MSPLPNDSILDTSSEPSVYTSRKHLLDMDPNDLVAFERSIEPFKYIPDTSSESSFDVLDSLDTRHGNAGTFFFLQRN